MSKFCPKCGEELVDNAKFCKSCGINLDNLEKNKNAFDDNKKQFMQASQKNYMIAIIVGYILAVFIRPLGILVSIYLLTRDSEDAKKHGKYILIISLGLLFLSFSFSFY